MSKPTKFELMRAGRERAQSFAPRRGNKLIPWGPISFIDEPQDPSPSIPTMEIDGVAYRERASQGPLDCEGCAFFDDPDFNCNVVTPKAQAVFGGGCIKRSVVYIKAA